MQLLKLPACLESRRSRVHSPRSSIQAFKFQRNHMFLPSSLINIQYCGDRDREVASSASDRLEGSAILFTSGGFPSPV